MSWLLPSLPSIPGWSRSHSSSTSKPDEPPIDDPEDDTSPPLPSNTISTSNSTSIPSTASASTSNNTPIPSRQQLLPPPSFSIAPPSPPHSEPETDPSNLNIAIFPSPTPLGNMPPPPSTTIKPKFGIQPGGFGGGDTIMPPPRNVNGIGKKKGKVALDPGHSALDWARLSSSGRNLRGTDTFPLRVTMAELKSHNTRKDAWSVFNGNVYNLTRYMRYHPGGEDQLMLAAGRDGTKLFMNTHSWVNIDHMMQECMVGMLVRG